MLMSKMSKKIILESEINSFFLVHIQLVNNPNNYFIEYLKNNSNDFSLVGNIIKCIMSFTLIESIIENKNINKLEVLSIL